MGREIITISIGGCGVSLGCKYWQQICEEHSVDYMGNYYGEHLEELEQIDVSFREGVEKFVPRAFFVDQNASCLERLYNSNVHYLFDREQTFFDNTNVQNNYATIAHTKVGENLALSVQERLRKNVEVCDSFHGFQILHACAGGVGSGATGLLLQNIKWELPKCSVVTASVFEDACAEGMQTHIVTTPINTTLVTRKIIEYSDLTICFDNVTLAHVCENSFNIKNAKIDHHNDAICALLTRFTSSVRFRGSLNANIKKIICNMVPFPRISFIVGTYEPCALKKHDPFRNEDEKMNTTLWPQNIFFNMDVSKGQFISIASMFRGNWENEVCDTKMTELQFSYKFVNWIPRHIITNLVKFPEPHVKDSVAFLGNHTSMGKCLQRQVKQFNQMFGHKGKEHPFIHHYTKYGLTEDIFYESSAIIEDVALEYIHLDNSHASSKHKRK